VTGPSQRPLPDNTQHSQETDIPASSEIWTRNPGKRSRGHWDWLSNGNTGSKQQINTVGKVYKPQDRRQNIYNAMTVDFGKA